MKKLITLTIILLSFSLFGKKDFSKIYQQACWEKYGYNSTLALKFCPSHDEIKKLISKR